MKRRRPLDQEEEEKGGLDDYLQPPPVLRRQRIEDHWEASDSQEEDDAEEEEHCGRWADSWAEGEGEEDNPWDPWDVANWSATVPPLVSAPAASSPFPQAAPLSTVSVPTLKNQRTTAGEEESDQASLDVRCDDLMTRMTEVVGEGAPPTRPSLDSLTDFEIAHELSALLTGKGATTLGLWLVWDPLTMDVRDDMVDVLERMRQATAKSGKLEHFNHFVEIVVFVVGLLNCDDEAPIFPFTVDTELGGSKEEEEEDDERIIRQENELKLETSRANAKARAMSRRKLDRVTCTALEASDDLIRDVTKLSPQQETMLTTMIDLLGKTSRGRSLLTWPTFATLKPRRATLVEQKYAKLEERLALSRSDLYAWCFGNPYLTGPPPGSQCSWYWNAALFSLNQPNKGAKAELEGKETQGSVLVAILVEFLNRSPFSIHPRMRDCCLCLCSSFAEKLEVFQTKTAEEKFPLIEQLKQFHATLDKYRLHFAAHWWDWQWQSMCAETVIEALSYSSTTPRRDILASHDAGPHARRYNGFVRLKQERERHRARLRKTLVAKFLEGLTEDVVRERTRRVREYHEEPSRPTNQPIFLKGTVNLKVEKIPQRLYPSTSPKGWKRVLEYNYGQWS